MPRRTLEAFRIAMILGPGLLFMRGAAGAESGDWPQFRGRDARGVSEADGLPTEWSTKKNVRWAIDLPGRSWSSPIVVGKKVFVTTAVNSGKNHTPKKGLYFGGERRKPIPHEHSFEVHCYSLDSGKLIWKKVAEKSKPQKSIHIKNTYASETPVSDGLRLYAYFGNIGVFTYDLSGKKLWEKRFEPVPTRYGWGSAASPIVHDGKLIIVSDNDESSFVACFDGESGRELWKIARDEKSNWSTPFVWEAGGRTEIVTPGSSRVRSYNLGGEELWSLKGMSSITIATPYASHGLLYVTSGYVGDKHKPIYAIRPGAKGDISLNLKDKEKENEFIAWYQPKAAPYNPSTIVYGDYLYTLLDFGFFACYEARTGKKVYGKQRLTVGKGFTTSPWAYDGKIFCLDEDGETAVIQAGPEFKIVRRNPLEEMSMATPAIAGTKLLIRTISKLYCIENEPPGEK